MFLLLFPSLKNNQKNRNLYNIRRGVICMKQEIFKEQLIRQIKEGSTQFKITGLLHSKTKLNLAMTSLNGKNISLDMPVKEVKIRFQPLYLEEDIWKQAPYRLDNSHEKENIHTHWFNEPIFPAFHLLRIRDVFQTILGTEFKEEEFN